MKPETEFKWLVNLLNSSYIKGYFKTNSGCKKDFERASGSSENNNEFKKWFDFLLEHGAIESYGNVSTNIYGKSVPTYVIVYKKLIKILRKNKFYQPIKKVMYDEYESLK